MLHLIQAPVQLKWLVSITNTTPDLHGLNLEASYITKKDNLSGRFFYKTADGPNLLLNNFAYTLTDIMKKPFSWLDSWFHLFLIVFYCNTNKCWILTRPVDTSRQNLIPCETSWGKVPSKHTTHGSLFVIVYAILEWQQVTKIHQKGRKETTAEGHRPSADGALISENSRPNV